jgi:hypothetical protein
MTLVRNDPSPEKSTGEMGLCFNTIRRLNPTGRYFQQAKHIKLGPIKKIQFPARASEKSSSLKDCPKAPFFGSPGQIRPEIQ